MYKTETQKIWEAKNRTKQQMIYQMDTGITVKRFTLPIETRDQLKTAAEIMMNVSRDMVTILNRKNNFYNTKIEVMLLIHEANLLLKSQANENGEDNNYKGAK
tara:strand:- start:324 stop:632 length:309 start_codon:yes stop_codon:yes gene_type:complete